MPKTRYIWDPETDAYLMETDGDGNTTAVYTQEPKPYGGLISQRRDGQDSYYQQDALGSTRQLTDAGEAVTDEYTYSAYGETVASSGSTVNPFRWIGGVGYYHDDETGDYYVRVKYYLPNSGRWSSRDEMSSIVGSDSYTVTSASENTNPLGMVSIWSIVSWPLSSAADVHVVRTPLLAPEPDLVVSPISYGNYCGAHLIAPCKHYSFGSGGVPAIPPGATNQPIDPLDAACAIHDCCLWTPVEFLNPCQQLVCNAQLCAVAADMYFNGGCSRAHSSVPATTQCLAGALLVLSSPFCAGAPPSVPLLPFF